MFLCADPGECKVGEWVFSDSLIVHQPLVLLLAVAQEAVQWRHLRVDHHPKLSPLLQVPVLEKKRDNKQCHTLTATATPYTSDNKFRLAHTVSNGLRQVNS